MADCRKFDKRHGYRNDLDLPFVRSELAKGCAYCGESATRITLDRIDNDIGHVRSNVVPACLRCNYMRGSMPYQAWLYLVPKVREARDLGLFGLWRSMPFNRTRVQMLEAKEPEYLTAPIPRRGTPNGTKFLSKSKTFPPAEELRRRVRTTSLRQVAKELGCSHVTVWQYLRKESPVS